MEIQLKLTKNCKAVDKYEQTDAAGEPLKEPVIGPVYLNKTVAKGKEKITITVS